MKISTREATENDMAKVFDLVQELAIFEKEPDAIEIDVAYYINNGFKKNPLFKCFIAEKENSIIGIALIGANKLKSDEYIPFGCFISVAAGVVIYVQIQFNFNLYQFLN